MKDVRTKLITILLLGILALALVTAAPDPLGATLTPGPSSRGTSPSPSTANAQAGNVTQMNIDQTRITEIWQGFYGNVSGQIVLENSGGANFYDWTATALTGEVYASRSTISSWTSINCTNSTQWETEETVLSIPAAATDGVNETFSSTTHPTFQVGTKTFAPNACKSTRPYDGTGTAGQFYNVLLNSDLTNVVYTVVLAENQNAFDNSTVDFEILVPVDKAAALSTYYFYVELD